MNAIKQMALVTLASASLAAWAQAPDATQAAQPEKSMQGPTAEQRQEMKAKCAADPKACEAKRAEWKEKREKRREEMKAKCAADPQACEAKRAEWKEKREKRREEMKAKCEADPKACEAKRKEMRERMQERRKETGSQPDTQGSTQPPAS